MTKAKLEITPETTVGKLLDVYPELEEVLIGIAPPFKKLKNKVLRKTVAKIATIKHISSVGNVPLDILINTLRKSVGQEPLDVIVEAENYFAEKPDWFSLDKIVISFDEEKLPDDNTMTLVKMLREAKNVNSGEIIELVTTFLPAPGIDIMRSKGYSTWSEKHDGGIVKSYFLKN